MTPASSPVIVAGMHRSGTSLVASMISSLGIDLGEHQLTADRNNRRGYFEDVDFLALNRRMLNASPCNRARRSTTVSARLPWSPWSPMRSCDDACTRTS